MSSFTAMKLFRSKILLIFFLLSLPSAVLLAQVEKDSSSTTIYVENSDNTVVEKIDGQFVRYLKGNIRVVHDSTYFYCDTAILYDNEFYAQGNVVILQSDSTTIFSDSLYFNSDSSKAILNGRVLLLHEEKELRTTILEYEIDEKLAYYEHTALIRQDSTTLSSQIGLYKIKEDLILFKEHVAVKDSAFSLKADSLKYDSYRKKAIFTGPTLIDQDSAQIYCEDGYYDIENNNALFKEKAVYLEKKRKATADVIEYLSKSELIQLLGNAHYQDEDQDVKADTIKYFRERDISELIGSVNVSGDKNNITGKFVVYNNETGDFISRGRSRLSEENMILTADYIDFSEEDGMGEAHGDIIFQDTSSQMEILCDSLITFDDNQRFKAYNDSITRPLMRKIMDKDTLFLAADTLYSYEIIENGDSIQMLSAYQHVKIFHKEFQAIADSMNYNSTDSVFILFRNPVMWSDTTQFSGDTISIFMADDKIDKLHLRLNAMIVNYQAGELYNQIGGKTIFAFFRDDTLTRMTTSGNAESLYYLRDDEDRFINAVKTVCSQIEFFFEDNDLKDIKYYNDPVSKMSSIKKEIINPQRLKGFKWELDKKPIDRNVDIIPLSEILSRQKQSPAVSEDKKEENPEEPADNSLEEKDADGEDQIENESERKPEDEN